MMQRTQDDSHKKCSVLSLGWRECRDLFSTFLLCLDADYDGKLKFLIVIFRYFPSCFKPAKPKAPVWCKSLGWNQTCRKCCILIPDWTNCHCYLPLPRTYIIILALQREINLLNSLVQILAGNRNIICSGNVRRNWQSLGCAVGLSGSGNLIQGYYSQSGPQTNCGQSSR